MIIKQISELGFVYSFYLQYISGSSAKESSTNIIKSPATKKIADIIPNAVGSRVKYGNASAGADGVRASLNSFNTKLLTAQQIKKIKLPIKKNNAAILKRINNQLLV